MIGHEILKDPGSAGGPYAASTDIVLVRDWDAVQRTAIDAACEVVVQCSRTRSCRRFRDREERIQARIPVRNTPQRFFGELAHRKLLGSKGGADFGDRHDASPES